MPDADDVALADEEMRLAEGDAAVDQLRGAGDDEQRVAILLELRPLVRHARRPRWRGRAGGTRAARGSSSSRLGSRRPIQTTWPSLPAQSAALLDGDVGDAPAVAVDAGGDDAVLGRLRLRKAAGMLHADRSRPRLPRGGNGARTRLSGAEAPAVGQPPCRRRSRGRARRRAPRSARGRCRRRGRSPRRARCIAPVVRFFTRPAAQHDHPGGEEGDAGGRRLDQAHRVHAHHLAAVGVELDEVQGDRARRRRRPARPACCVRSPAERASRLALEADQRAEHRRADQAQRR